MSPAMDFAKFKLANDGFCAGLLQSPELERTAKRTRIGVMKTVWGFTYEPIVPPFNTDIWPRTICRLSREPITQFDSARRTTCWMKNWPVRYKKSGIGYLHGTYDWQQSRKLWSLIGGFWKSSAQLYTGTTSFLASALLKRQVFVAI